jgi:hypothetical protein
MNFKKFVIAYQRDQFIGLINVFFSKIGLTFRIKNSIQKRVILLEQELKKISQKIVMNGYYSGMKLAENYKWNEYDYCSKVLGLYEKEVQQKLAEFTFDNFINLGCAEGYHLLGQIFSNKKKKSIGFEINDSFIQVLKKSANENCISDRLQLFGKAENNFVDFLVKNKIDLNKSCFLIDIEGYEFSILNKANLNKLKKSRLIIEFHPTKDEKKNIEFLASLRSYFNLEILKTSERDLSVYNKLKNFSDIDRWLMVSENRPNLMNWIVCTPK